jgi:hypothetical protein
MSRFAGLVFAVAGLAGPFIRLATWPPSRFEEITGTNIADFVYHLVLFLWPTQPLAALEQSVGPVMAGLFAIGGNILLFVVAGLAVGAVSARRYAVGVLYAVVSGLIVLLAVWSSGFSSSHLRLLPLIVALALYAIPFWLVARAAAVRAP